MVSLWRSGDRCRCAAFFCRRAGYTRFRHSVESNPASERSALLLFVVRNSCHGRPERKRQHPPRRTLGEMLINRELPSGRSFRSNAQFTPDSASRSLPVKRDTEKHAVYAQTVECVVDVQLVLDLHRTCVLDQSIEGLSPIKRHCLSQPSRRVEDSLRSRGSRLS